MPSFKKFTKRKVPLHHPAFLKLWKGSAAHLYEVTHILIWLNPKPTTVTE
jgi:hypothetical protein